MQHNTVLIVKNLSDAIKIPVGVGIAILNTGLFVFRANSPNQQLINLKKENAATKPFRPS